MSASAKYQKDAGFEHEGCWYEDMESLIQVGLLGFCACGDPDANLEYILKGLELIDEKSPVEPKWINGAPCPVWKAWFDEHQIRREGHFKTDEAERFFQYWCDKEGFTDHGGSIPGWLTDAGVELLALLREWNSVEEEAA